MSLCERAAATGLDAQPRPYDSDVSRGAGEARDLHFKAPALLFGKTEDRRPSDSSIVGDVGHTLVVGPTGAGKSVLLALMAL